MSSICMYTPSAGGGHALYTFELLTALNRRANRDRRYELVTSSDLDSRFRSAIYPVHAILPPLAHRREYRSTLTWALGRLTHYPAQERCFLDWLQSRPDVIGVHCQEFSGWGAPRLVRRIRAMGKKVFYTAHNIRPHKYPPLFPKALCDRWCREACRACDGLFVHTTRLAEQLSEFLGGEHPPIRVAPHGVWTTDAPRAKPLVERLREKRLLFFGTIRRNKGLHLLLDAALLLPGYQLTIAGEPTEPDYFREEILPRLARLKAAAFPVDLMDRFIADDEVSSIFEKHSAIVLPYTADFTAQSGVVYMALAHDTPVVATAAGGLGELLGQFRIGTTFLEQTPAALGNAVNQLFQRSDGHQLSQQLEAAKRHFSWTSAARATADGYGASEAAGGAT